MAVIHNEGKMDYVMTDIMDKEPHISLMLDYLKNNYKDDLFLQQCDYYTAVNKIAMYLCSLGEIVFLNTTSYQKELLSKYGHSGIMMMPKKLKEEQIYNLFKLKDMLEKLNELQIWYNITEDGRANMKIGNPDVISEYVKTKRYVRKGK